MMAKEGLIAEFLSQREALLQACWAHQLWSRKKLQTADGQALDVIFQGWLNKGPGPDFTEARLRVGDSELFGDVEIHTEASNWKAHGHHKDSAYERVVLHVVLEKGGHSPQVSVLGRDIPVFPVLPHVSLGSIEFMRNPESMLKQYEQLPGRCGLRAASREPDGIKHVIAHAAEERARQKAERLIPGWDGKAEEQTLFELVFQSLGYRHNADVFRDLAGRFPLGELDSYLDLPVHQARGQVLARWFGALGLLDGSEHTNSGGGAKEDYAAWKGIWEKHGNPAGGGRLTAKLKRGGSRPWNSPERRLVGLFHHLYTTGGRGWLKSWLGLLHQLDGLRDKPGLKKAAVNKLEQAFATPEWESWRNIVTFSSAPLTREARLIGSDRITILMANAVIPFFLAYARKRRDKELEKLLYRLFIVLPPEAPNQRTRFMEKRLLVLGSMPRTLRMHQGLLQIHQDFCTSFHEGCQDCAFPDLISATPGQA